MIRRSPSVTRQSYTIVPNVTLNDINLSWEAKGMLAYLISKPDNWVIMVNHLVKESPNAKKEKVLAILNELETNGYITNNGQRINSEKGRFSHTERIVHEVSIHKTSGQTVGGFTVNGETVNGSTVNGEVPHLVSTEDKQLLNKASTENKNDSSSAVKTADGQAEKPFSSEFQQLWAIYPRKVGRKMAYDRVVARLRAGTPFSELLESTQNYAALRVGEEASFTMHPATFYGPNLRYEDYLDNGEAIRENEAPKPSRIFSAINEFLSRGDD